MSETTPDAPVPDSAGLDAPVLDSAGLDAPEQVRVRTEKLERLQAAGTPGYPVAVPRTHDLAEIHAGWDGLATGEETQDVVSVAGRVVFVRNTGKLCFASLQGGFSPALVGDTRLQVMLSRDEVGEQRLADWKVDVDLGDHVSVTGRVVRSRRGELSVMATTWTLAAKALRPLPNLHAGAGLAEETRVRQRHADLTVRPAARELLRTRAAITRALRETLHGEDYLEVETPVLQTVHGGAAARPFHTHLNAFGTDMTLRIALELYLKRAMVGGVERVYEIGRIFRNEGIDSTHSAEFSMLEAYAAWGDQQTVADLVRRLVLAAADVAGGRQLTHRGSDGTEHTIDLDAEWRWVGVYPGLSEAVGQSVTPETDAVTLAGLATAHDVEVDPAWGAEKLVLELFGELVEPTLIQPTFVCDYPPSAQPLARPHREDPRLIEAWDLVIGGVERGTGFSELIDPVVQRERLTAQSLAAAAGDPEAMQLDEEFLAALEFGAPPMGGLGLGVDRLVMLFTGVGIRETILFPLLRPVG